MLEIANIEKLEATIAAAESFLVVLGENYTLDELAAALALGLSLEKAGKKVTVFSPRQALVEEASLFGVSQVTNQLSLGKLVISIPDALVSVDKVTHYLDGENLNIVVHPIDSTVRLETDKVTVQKQASVANCLILINRKMTEFQDTLSPQEQKSYANLPAFVIGKVLTADNIGIWVSAADADIVSVSETTTWIVKRLGLPIDSDCASNLFQGMSAATGFVPPAATASTFEAAAFCLAQKPIVPGVKRQDLYFAKSPPTPKVASQLPPEEKSYPQQSLSFGNVPPNQTGSQVMEDPGQIPSFEKQNNQVQSDWLVPKIFKSSGKPGKT